MVWKDISVGERKFEAQVGPSNKKLKENLNQTIKKTNLCVGRP